MRKIIFSILAVVVILTSFSVIAFASDDAVYFGDGTGAITATEDTISIDVYLTPTEDMAAMWISNLEAVYSITNGSISAATKVNGLSPLTDTSSKANAYYYALGEDSYTPTPGNTVKIANITVSREGTAATSVLSFSNVVIGDYAGDPYSGYTTGTLTITWPKDVKLATVTPGTAITKTYVGKTSGNTYSNVWFNTFAAVNNDQIIKSITLKFNSNEEDLNIGSVLEGGGTYTFDVAIVGAPANADVQVDFVAVDAE